MTFSMSSLKAFDIANMDHEIDSAVETKSYVVLAPYTMRSIKPFQKGVTLHDRFVYVCQTIFMMLSGRWFYNNLLDTRCTAPHEVYDRLLSQWSGIGIISALTSTFAFGAFVGTIPNPENLAVSGMDVTVVINIITFVSICGFFISLCSSVLLSMAIMTLPKEVSVHFVREMKIFITFPEMFLVCGIFIFIAAMFLAGWSTSGYDFVYYCAPALTGSMGLVILLWGCTVLTLDRVGGLWESAKISEAAILASIKTG